LLEGNNTIDGVHGVHKKTILPFHKFNLKNSAKCRILIFLFIRTKKDNLSTPCTPLNNVCCWKSDAFKMYLYVVL